MSKRSRFFSSSNPFSNESAYAKAAQAEHSGNITTVESANHMTIKGAMNKSFLLLGIITVMAFIGAYLFTTYQSMSIIYVPAIIAFIVVLISNFAPKQSAIWAIIYAVTKGIVVGAISIAYATMFYPGIIMNALMLTIAVVFLMLTLYRTGVIKVTERFKSIMYTALGAIVIVYVVHFVMGMSGFDGVPYLHTMHPISIGISLVITGVAALMLVIYFDAFVKGEEQKAPIYMEWFASLGLVVTIIWLYLEILSLLARFSGD